jgi:hypothetical protein
MQMKPVTIFAGNDDIAVIKIKFFNEMIIHQTGNRLSVLLPSEDKVQ